MVPFVPEWFGPFPEPELDPEELWAEELGPPFAGVVMPSDRGDLKYF